MDSDAIICLMGPTCTGKSKLALDIVQHLPCEIVSVDSTLAYRGMDIGTAKPDQQTLNRVRHHLINICEPTEQYTAGKFLVDVDHAIKDIKSRNKIPLLVGGTMLYFNLLTRGMAPLPPADATLRKQMEAEAKLKGWQTLHYRLHQVDPESALRIHPNDSQRIQRALEVYQLTGKTISQHFVSQQQHKSLDTVINIALIPKDRKKLHKDIHQRFQGMLANGLIEEVSHLFQMEGMSLQSSAMRAVGYRQVWLYLTGKYDKQEMEMKANVATRQLAKQQLTWLRSWDDLKTFEPDSYNLSSEIIAYLSSRT